MREGRATDLYRRHELAELYREVQTRREARKHLIPFAQRTHPDWCTGEHHRVIADALEAAARREINRLIISAPPRHTKSEMVSKRFPAWVLGNQPTSQVLAATYSGELALDWGRDVRSIVKSDEYRSVFPDVTLSVDSKAAGRWHTNKGGIYISAGIGGTVTGRGADFGIIDDAFKGRKEADNPKQRATVWKFYTATWLPRLMPNAVQVIMGTRWHDDDLIGRILNHEGQKWHHVCLPAIRNEGTDHEEALWPEWFGIEYLQELRESIPPREWQALYQQNPATEDGDYLKRAYFEQRYDKPPKGLDIYMAGDFGLTEPEEGNDPDPTEFAVVGLDHANNIYPLDWWHGFTTPDVWVDRFLDLVKQHDPLAVFLEGGIIRRAIEPFLKQRMQERGVFVRIEWVNPVKSKAVRGRPLQGMAAMGRIIFPDTHWAHRVIDQCVGFPAVRYDDAFDALSTFCMALGDGHPAISETRGHGDDDHPRGDYNDLRSDEADNWRTA